MTESEMVSIDEAIQEIFAETDLEAFQSKLIFDKQLTRLEHFFYVSDAELKNYGLSEPAIRRLRAAIDRKRRKRAKFFGSNRKKIRLIQVKRAPLPVEQQGFEFNNTQPFLIPKNELKLMETLGEGNFSVVKRAIWTRSVDGNKTECAVKILHEMSEPVRQDLALEISNMQKLRHQNLVQLFGIVFADSTLMVLEYCEGGSLLNRLRDQNKPRPLVSTLLNYAQQIATGMSYLESRRCVHRDLAARNVLLSHEEQLIKICDFGLTRALSENERLYIMQVPKKVPFSWCPPESLRFRQFSHKSDVWAFGVTMWELYTYGEEPWIGSRAAEVLQFIESGQRLRQPEYCPQELYEIMKMCWYNEATLRPKFSNLRKLLIDFKFMQIICRNQNVADGQLHMLPGDEILLISEQGINNKESEIWYGQSMNSRKFGEFPCASVAMKTIPMGAADKSTLKQSNQQSQIEMNDNAIGRNNRNGAIQQQQKTSISFPVIGSFIHTGHGDIDERQCWGHVDHIDDIYLKNPIIGPNTMEQTSIDNQKVTFIPSLMTVHKDKALPRPPPPQMVDGFSLIPQSSAKTNTSADENWPVLPQFSMPMRNNTNGLPYFHSAIQTATRMAPNRFSTNNISSSFISTPHSQIANVDSGISSISSQNSSQQHQRVALSNDALEWISNELAQLNIASTSYRAEKNNSMPESTAPMNQLNPSPQQKNGSEMPSNSSSSKYDSSISILRPKRTSPNRLTPPIVLAESFVPKCSSSTPIPSSPPNIAASIPSSSHLNLYSLENEKEENVINKNFGQKAAELQPRQILEKRSPLMMKPNRIAGGDDPFWIKEDVKTLTTKLPYKEVHKASGFLDDGQQNDSNQKPISYSQQQQHEKSINVAVVAPFMMPTLKQTQKDSTVIQNEIKDKSIPVESTAQNADSISSKYDSINGSLLPPPSQLLLSGFDPQKTIPASKDGSHFKYQPIFDISGNSTFIDHLDFNYSPENTATEDRPRLRYGSNGIPILEPIPMQSFMMTTTKLADQVQQATSSTLNKNPKTMITLSELNTEALLKRVKNYVDFASLEQCRQYLLCNGFNVERTIRELKIEKLIELGLTTDRKLAASALDSEKWDINAAANRLCYS